MSVVGTIAIAKPNKLPNPDGLLLRYQRGGWRSTTRLRTRLLTTCRWHSPETSSKRHSKQCLSLFKQDWKEAYRSDASKDYASHAWAKIRKGSWKMLIIHLTASIGIGQKHRTGLFRPGSILRRIRSQTAGVQILDAQTTCTSIFTITRTCRVPTRTQPRPLSRRVSRIHRWSARPKFDQMVPRWSHARRKRIDGSSNLDIRQLDSYLIGFPGCNTISTPLD